ncbi:DUF4386 domain-containing protein [Phenylobacterium sp.]|uniref:DUF4386 domain-containing protein n=1 Tax=Phenylobacterium sp. TaxID=1871053 RepID=UPI00390CD255
MNAARRTAGVLWIVAPLVFAAGFAGLQLRFDYPDILRRPPGEVLVRFAAGGAELQAYWYAMTAAAVLMIGAAIATGLVLRRHGLLLAALSVGAGVLAGLVQALGLLRWVMLVPALATAYTAPEATQLDKAMAVALFDAANRYLGMGVGEHLGYLFTGAWTIFVSALLFRKSRVFALAGAVLAAGVVFGMAEPYGAPLAGAVNAAAYTLWTLWALVLGVMMLRDRREPQRAVWRAQQDSNLQPSA